MCSIGSSKDSAAGAGLSQAIGGAQGVGAPSGVGGSLLTGARRVNARPNTILGGSGGGSGAGDRERPGHRPTRPGGDIFN